MRATGSASFTTRLARLWLDAQVTSLARKQSVSVTALLMTLPNGANLDRWHSLNREYFRTIRKRVSRGVSAFFDAFCWTIAAQPFSLESHLSLHVFRPRFQSGSTQSVLSTSI